VREPAAPGSLALAAVGGAVVNLTGPPQRGGIVQRPTLAPECWLAGEVLQRTLREEEAAATLAEIAAGSWSRWLLAWLPLMQGGRDPGIINGWKHEAMREPQERDRGILAGLTLTFAELAECRPPWQQALEGWNVIKSAYLEELREKVRAEGRLEALREMVLRLGRQRFRKAAGHKHKAQLQALTDRARLERICDRILSASSWDDLLATP
jgi:hypothetical protein